VISFDTNFSFNQAEDNPTSNYSTPIFLYIAKLPVLRSLVTYQKKKEFISLFSAA